MQKYVIALYIRLSMEDYKYESMSIENQRLVLNAHAASMPEYGNAEILEFVDNGYTGTNFERPQVQKLIEMVRENKIDCIIVKDFSRFGRNSLETGYFLERVFPLFHTRFISISNDYDSNNFKGDTGGMDVAFQYLISEYYSRDMSIKTKSSKYAKMQRGEYQSEICPYGYQKSADGRMEPDPETADVVRLIFRLSSEGVNAAGITRELFRRGIPTPGDYKAAHGICVRNISRSNGVWCASTVLNILKDERYIGTYITGKRAVLEVGGTKSRQKDRDQWCIIPDHHPAIVEREVFDMAQEKQFRFSIPKKKQYSYPLRGKVFCGCCSHALSRVPQSQKYYVCRHSQGDPNSRCFSLLIPVADLEQAVFQALKKQMESILPDKSEKSIPSGVYVAEQSEYERQIESLNDDKQLLFERYCMGEIDMEKYKSEKASLDAEILRIQNVWAAVTAQAKRQQEEQIQRDRQNQIWSAVAEAEGLTPELVDMMIEKVVVFPDKRIDIEYKTKGLFK